MEGKKIGLALSSGGIFGFAHMGVIEVLEEHQIFPEIIAGSSSGAIIGLVYCAQGLSGLREFCNRLEESGLLTPRGIFTSWSPNNYFDKVAQLLDKQIIEKDFDELKKQFICPTTDVISGEAALITSGNPVEATLASASYPVAFSTRSIHGRPQMDGGITSYLPSEPLRQHDTTIVIGSCIKVGQDISRDKARHLNKMSLGLRSIEILQEQLSRFQIRQCDFCFRPEFHSEDRFKFGRIREIVEVGHLSAQNQVNLLLKILGQQS